MAAQTKRTGNKPEDKGTYLTRENWEVMKPFVHFAFKAIALIGSATWAIIKFAPKLLAHQEDSHKNDKVIKL